MVQGMPFRPHGKPMPVVGQGQGCPFQVPFHEAIDSLDALNGLMSTQPETTTMIDHSKHGIGATQRLDASINHCTLWRMRLLQKMQQPLAQKFRVGPFGNNFQPDMC